MSGHPGEAGPEPDPAELPENAGRREGREPGDRAPGGADRLAPPGVLPESADERRERSRTMRYAGVGLQFGLTILVFLMVGRWLDRRLGTDPLFLYLGVFLGAGGAFYSMYRSLMADVKRDEEARAKARAAQDATARGRRP